MGKKFLLRVLCAFTLLIISPMFITLNTKAEAIQPYASYYLDSYGSYVYPAGDSLIQVYFTVEGTGYMDELGALSIEIYECSTNSSNIKDWTWKKRLPMTVPMVC